MQRVFRASPGILSVQSADRGFQEVRLNTDQTAINLRPMTDSKSRFNPRFFAELYWMAR